MPPKKPRPSRRRTVTYQEDGKFVNRPSIKGAPKAKSPRKFKTEEEAIKAAKRLSRRLATRSMSTTRGSFTPGGGKTKPKSANVRNRVKASGR